MNNKNRGEQAFLTRSEDGYVAPRTQTERSIAKIWQKVLDVDLVSIDANFFELGGDSVSLIQVMTEITKMDSLLDLNGLLQILEQSEDEEDEVSSKFFATLTVAWLAEQVETFRQSDKGTSTVASSPQQFYSRPDELPLSFAQQRLWFLDQFEPQNPSYIIPSRFYLTGPLHVAALHRSLRTLEQRHEVLRTTILTIEGRPCQRIAPTARTRLPLIDLSALPAPQQEQQLLLLTQQEALQPFSLAAGPLLRYALLRLHPQRHLFLFSVHHILFDGWSRAIFWRELACCYEAALSQQPADLPPLPWQYADFALWQRRWLQGPVLHDLLSYWLTQLADAPVTLDLPTDHPRPALQRFRGGMIPTTLSTSLSQALQALSQREGVTLFMTLLTGWLVVLARWSGQDDLIVGTPIANRTRNDLAGLIGFFVNTLPLRVRLTGNPSLRQVLARVRDVALQAYAHQELPYEKLIEELAPQRDASRQALVQVAFVYQNVPPVQVSQMGGLRCEPWPQPSQTAKFDVSVSISETEQGLSVQLEYNSDLFEPATAQRLLAHLQQVWQQMPWGLERRVGEVTLLSEQERAMLLRPGWQREPQQQAGLVEQLEGWGQRQPDAIALVHEDRQLSYGELNRQANQLGHYLRVRGLKPEGRVGLCLPRSLELVIALLAILKAGGVYVPLDPSYPSERVSWLVRDARLSLLLTQNDLLARFSEYNGQIVCLDTDQDLFAQRNEDNLKDFVTGDNLVSIIYTSGSTGKPKGVMNTHRGLRNRIEWMQTIYPLTGSDQVLQKTPLSFDVSAWELLWPLTNGACLVMAQPEGHRDSIYLAEIVEERGITVIHFVPSMLQVFLEEPEIKKCHGLKIVICSGEALSVELQERFFASLQAKLYNLYGPTEASIEVTYWECLRNSPLRCVPIGHPITNTQVYLLDKYLQLVPIGVPGDLYIAGICLARGYWNRPDLTAERFIPNPLDDIPGTRLYRTGDRAYYLPDGSIVYLGRDDHQIKVRGFRIELGEIEAVLRQHDAVQECVVIAQENVSGNKRLIACIVPKSFSDAPFSDLATQLRAYLGEQLPDYMVPSLIVQLEAIPLTSSGKVDRQALLSRQWEKVETTKSLTPPRTVVEQMLCNIWLQVLGVKQVSIHDNFFELGGDSILTIQVVARARKVGLSLTVKQLFQYQTISSLAAVAQAVESNQAEQGVVTGPIPLTPIQYWFFEQNLSAPHHWNQARLLTAQRPLNPTLLERALQHLLMHHDALRLRFVQTASGWEQYNAGVQEQSIFQYLDLAELEENRQRHVLEQTKEALQSSLNLTEGPLIRVALFRLGGGEPDRLFLVIHHLAVDGVSWRILLEDLQTVYEQLEHDEPVLLPAKTTSFQHWARQLRQYAQASTVESELAYWLGLGSIHQKAAALPLDYAGKSNTVDSSCEEMVSLSPDETQILLRKVPAVFHVQINEVLLTALARTLADWTGMRSCLIEMEGHGREEIIAGIELSRTVGWFTTVFPVSLSLSEAHTLDDNLQRVKAQLQEIPQKGIGYGLLRYLHSTETATKLQMLPQAQIIFNYLGQFNQGFAETALWRPSREQRGNTRSPQDHRRYLLEVTGSITDGQFSITWVYSQNIHKPATIKQLVQNFMGVLRSIIARCQSSEMSRYTPADFPAARIGQSDLEILMTKIAEKDE